MTSTSFNAAFSINDIVQRIFLSKQITRLDQKLLQSVFLSQSNFSPQDYRQINCVFDALRAGRFKWWIEGAAD